MRFLILILAFGSTLFSNERMYELQLYASKTDDIISMNKIINRASKVNLNCLITRDDLYSFVKCDRYKNWRDIHHSGTKARKANLEYFILKMKQSEEEKEELAPIIEKKELSNLDAIGENLFSKNSELLRMLYNQDSNSKFYLEDQKGKYLDSVAKMNAFNGLYFKGRSAANLEKNKLDYDLRLEWDILDGGYFGSKKDVQDAVLKKTLAYDRLLDEINSANLELSLHKISSINNLIRYQFSKHKEIVLHDVMAKKQKKYRASIITKQELHELSKLYESTKKITDYYSLLEHQKYDTQMKNFIENIENIKLADKQSLLKEAFLNSFLLNRSKNQIYESQNIEQWSDRLRTNVYIENKRHFFLDRADTIAGVQVEIPLDYYDDDRDKVQNIEIEATRIKEKSIKKLISQNIEEIYHKIAYYKINIKRLQEDLKYYQNRVEEISLKSKYPLPTQKKDPADKLVNIELSLIDIHQKIWVHRTEILRELLKIQYISGIQVLSA